MRTRRRCEHFYRIIAMFSMLSKPEVFLLFIEIIKNPTCPPSRVSLPFLSLYTWINRFASLISLEGIQAGMTEDWLCRSKCYTGRGVNIIQYLFSTFLAAHLKKNKNSLFNIQAEYFIPYSALSKPSSLT